MRKITKGKKFSICDVSLPIAFLIRIPLGMSINALSVWINNQFTANKPKYFVSQSGKKWYLNDIKDKAQLNQIGKKK
jgi:hypothetical protein